MSLHGLEEPLPQGWDALVSGGDYVLQRAFLGALAEALGDGEVRVAHAARGGVLVGAGCFHLIPLRADRLGTTGARAAPAVRAMVGALSWLHRGRPRVLVCGHGLHADACGLAVAPGEDQNAVLGAMTDAVRQEAGASVALEVCTPLGWKGDAPPPGRHRVDAVQPTMWLPLSAEWRDFDDYLSGLRTKYRQRARSARKKGRRLVRRPLDVAGIERGAVVLNSLLEGVLDESDLALTHPDARLLSALKARLGEALTVTLLSVDEVPVGFTASILHNGVLDAWLVGLDARYNARHKVYQNALYDFIEAGIDANATAVHFGRTALEIKSAVGALPREVPVYVRHPWRPVHTVLGWVLPGLPEVSWTPRHPWKSPPAGAGVL